MDKLAFIIYSIFSKTFYYVTVIFLSFSCSESPTNYREGAEEILIDEKNPTVLPLDSIITGIEYIKLETTHESIMGNISQMVFIDSFIVVADKDVVHVFDLSGKFQRSLGHKGKGPGEYIDLNHICVDPLDHTLTILDRAQNREIHYHVNGTHAYTKRTPFKLSYFDYLESGFKAFYRVGMTDPALGKYKKSPLVVTGPENQVAYGDFFDYHKENIFNFTMNSPLRKFGDKVYFSPNFSNMIYQVTDSMAIPKYYLNIAWNAMPPVDQSTTNEMMRDYTQKYYFFNGDFVELEDLTFINIFTPKGSPFVVYSHAKKKTFFNTEDGEHPLFFFLKRKLPKARYKDNSIVFEISAGHLMMNKKDLYKYYRNHTALFDDLFSGLTEESNSVLFICHLNKDL